jgi:hypothetical protein
MTFKWMYVAAWIVGVIGVVCTSITGYQHFTAVPPSWLTPDVAGTCAIIAGICGAIEAFLPRLQMTPARRESIHKKSKAGILPEDIQAKLRKQGNPSA